MISCQAQGYIRAKIYLAENTAGQHLSKPNWNTGEFSANYQWRVSPWIILIKITYLDNIIHYLHFFHILPKKIMINLTNMII